MNDELQTACLQFRVQRYWKKLLGRIENGEIDPSFVNTHRMKLDDAPHGFDIFLNKEDDCIKVVLKPERPHARSQPRGRDRFCVRGHGV